MTELNETLRPCAAAMYTTFYFSVPAALVFYGEIGKRLPRVSESCGHWLRLLATLVFFASGGISAYWFLMHVSPPFSAGHPWVSGWILALWVPLNFLSWAAILVSYNRVTDDETFQYMARRYDCQAAALQARLAPYNIRRFPVDDFEAWQQTQSPPGSMHEHVDRYLAERLAAFDRVLRRAGDATYTRDCAQYRQLSQLGQDIFTGDVCAYEKWRQLRFVSQ